MIHITACTSTPAALTDDQVIEAIREELETGFGAETVLAEQDGPIPGFLAFSFELPENDRYAVRNDLSCFVTTVQGEEIIFDDFEIN